MIEVLFDNAVFQAKLAMRSSQIMGVLWHQGESDCYDGLYKTYQARFEIMLQAFQKELDLHVPFIVGGLGDYLETYPLKDYIRINDALQSIAASNQMVGFACAEGLTSNPDHLHFNADALYQFGLRYFDEFERLRIMNHVTSENTVAADIQRSQMELL